MIKKMVGIFLLVVFAAIIVGGMVVTHGVRNTAISLILGAGITAILVGGILLLMNGKQ